MNDYNIKKGRGGQAAAARKYGVGTLSIAKWLKDGELNGTAKKKVTRVRSRVPAKGKDDAAAALERVAEIRDRMKVLRAEVSGLYDEMMQLASKVEGVDSKAKKEVGGKTQDQQKVVGREVEIESKWWNFQRQDQAIVKIAPQMACEREWANQDGKTIVASLLKLKDGLAVLKVKGGTVYRYPVEGLANDHQVELEELSKRLAASR
ncbi:MAG: hypothetical protein QM496_09915 [Verrucomicrobiota bacterium]